MSHLSSSDIIEKLKSEGYDAAQDGTAVIVLNPNIIRILK